MRVNQHGRPSDYVRIVRNKIREKNHSQLLEICLSGLEGAMVVACDTAQLLEHANVATVKSVETSRVMVESRYDSSTIARNLLQIILIERRTGGRNSDEVSFRDI